jgi:hypothetical protein
MKDDPDGCVIFQHSNAIKLTLDEHHKVARFYAIANLNFGTEECHDYYDFIRLVKQYSF